MNYSSIKNCDIANGPGVRVSLFVSGCRRHCPGCFNQETWSFDSGLPFTSAAEDDLLRKLSSAWVKGLTLLGGEPLEPENQPAVLQLVRRVRRELPGKTVWLFTGFTWEQLMSGTEVCCTPELAELLSLLDVMVDGPFLLPQRNISLRFRGSENQRLLDVQKSLAQGAPVLWEDETVYAIHGMPPRKEWD